MTPAGTLLDNVVFGTLVLNRESLECARLLAWSLRDFGGTLSNSPLWLFHSAPDDSSESVLDMADCVEAGSMDWPDGVEPVPLEPSASPDRYFFGRKVAACAQMETMAEGRYGSTVWMAPQCLVIRPPCLLRLEPPLGAALRAVHVKNVGASAEARPDAFWTAVYGLVGVEPPATTVYSLVDGQEIRPYYNSHLFSVVPDRGILRRWLTLFERAVNDEDLQRGPCADELHRIFLHQALLSALVGLELGPGSVRPLPPPYSYPLHFHQNVPAPGRARRLDECVCPVYEGAFVFPDTLCGLAPGPELQEWFERRMSERR